MAEQSSASVLFRAVVMLGCLVAVPLAAVFGTSLPEVVKQVLDGRWPGCTPAAQGRPGEAPAFQRLPGRDSAPTAPPRPMCPPRQQAAAEPDPAFSAGHSEEARCGAVAASFEQPLDPPPAETPCRVDQFSQIQDRLRQLGATYYLLETWGNQQPFYRFYCRVAVGGNPGCARYYFEATGPDPLQAMAEVLRQVDAWHAARR